MSETYQSGPAHERISRSSGTGTSRDRNWPVAHLSAGTFRAVNNTFKSISLDFEDITSLYMIGNPHLTEIIFRKEASDYGWSDIWISGNPELRLKSAKDFVNFVDYDGWYTPGEVLKLVFIWQGKIPHP
ncbi:hypothetical protein B0T16DRAFT_390275 [Cercophora newfieldiana]|uniref:Uncharacterized protein n=1 Tax=Cercophora newfieldiana TaxID=92897 RepID=A0AA40CNR7_9PEZI|nr:hypothetical protein B0T16DRAFT_390275 [Cercophora newfieldiana]